MGNIPLLGDICDDKGPSDVSPLPRGTQLGFVSLTSSHKPRDLSDSTEIFDALCTLAHKGIGMSRRSALFQYDQLFPKGR